MAGHGTAWTPTLGATLGPAGGEPPPERRDAVAELRDRLGYLLPLAVRLGVPVLAGTDGPLVDYESLGRDALLSIPTPDHYLPLLYVIALRQQGEPIAFPVEGVDGGSVSMLSIRIG